MENFLELFNTRDVTAAPPESFSVYLKALWYDGKGEWNKAHNLIDQLENSDAARLHAYLHRKEGDDANAGYWYRRAGSTPSAVSLDAEWKMLVGYFTERV